MIDNVMLDYLIAVIVVLVTVILVFLIFNFVKSKQLSKTFQDLIAENEKLKRDISEFQTKIKDIKDSSRDFEIKFEKVSKIIQGFLRISQKSYSEFFDGLLDLALSVVPEAKSGSISIIDGREWKFMAIRGNGKNPEKLKSLNLKSEWMISIPKVTVIEDIAKSNEKRVPKEYSDMIEEAVGGHIYRSIAIPLKFGNDFIGNCFLDALSDIEFSESSKIVMEEFGILASIFLTLKRLETLPHLSINNTLRVIVNFYEMKNSSTRGHSENVAYLSVKIGEKMNLSPKQIGDLYWSAIFHDIGLISIPDEITRKESALTKEELEIMKTHTFIGEKIIDPYDHLKEAAIVARSHHECFDGSGYPDGIKGLDIPLFSRIVSVADFFDTIKREGKVSSTDDAIKKIKERSGTYFDPDIVKMAIEVFPYFKR